MIYDPKSGQEGVGPTVRMGRRSACDNKRVQPHLHLPAILKDSNSLRKLCHHCLLVHPPTTCGLWSTTLYCRKSRRQIRSRSFFRASPNELQQIVEQVFAVHERLT
jgi:hypothetical protein